jgi:hypothetical protein
VHLDMANVWLWHYNILLVRCLSLPVKHRLVACQQLVNSQGWNTTVYVYWYENTVQLQPSPDDWMLVHMVAASPPHHNRFFCVSTNES